MLQKLKIGFNARPFTSRSMRGISRHTLELIRSLHHLDPSIEFYLYTYGSVDNFFKEQLNFVNWREVKVSPKLLWDFWILPRQLKKDHIGLFHSTNNIGLPFGSFKKILTIHDSLTHQDRLSSGLKNFWGRLNYRLEWLIAKRADAFITISQAAKKDIHQKLGIAQNLLTVIYNGVNRITPTEAVGVRQDFYLHVGGLEGRKNILYLISELEKAQTESGKKIYLKCISKKSSAPASVLEKMATSSLKIEIHEDVTDLELFDFYRSAKAFVSTSHFEGFGIPLIEAMLSKTPMIVSNLEVYREITNQEAYFFNQVEKDSLGNLIKKIETGDLDLKIYTDAAFEIAKKYDWDVMAKSTLSLYQKVINEK